MGYSTELEQPRITTIQNADASSSARSAGVLKKRWWLILIVALLVAAATYLVAHRIPAQYKSTASVVVEVSGSDPAQAATAANSVAGQYAQDVTAEAVIALANRRLSPADARGLGGAVSGGTVASQNIVQVSATGNSAEQAQRRAEATLLGLTEYVSALVTRETNTYSRAARAQLAPIASEIASITAQLNKATTAQLTSGRYLALQTTLSTLIAERASATAAIAQNATNGAPSVTPLSAAGPGSQTAPNPKLYAGVAFLLALIVVWQLLVAVSPRPR